MSFPTTAVYQDFNLADGDTTGWTPFAWGENAAIEVHSNVGRSGNYGVVRAASSPGIVRSADVESFITITTFSTTAYYYGTVVGVRQTAMDGSGNGYEAVMYAQNGGTFALIRRDNGNGTETEIGTGGPADFHGYNIGTVGNGDKIGIRCVGSTIQSWYKAVGGSWTMIDQVTDTTYASGGYDVFEVSADGEIDDAGGGDYIVTSTGIHSVIRGKARGIAR